jgi:hypothetical protein
MAAGTRSASGYPATQRNGWKLALTRFPCSIPRDLHARRTGVAWESGCRRHHRRDILCSPINSKGFRWGFCGDPPLREVYPSRSRLKRADEVCIIRAFEAS